MGWLSRISRKLDVEAATGEADHQREEAADALERARAGKGDERESAISDADWAATQARWAADDARSVADDAALELPSNDHPIDDELAVLELESAAADAEFAADEAEWDAWEADELDSL